MTRPTDFLGPDTMRRLCDSELYTLVRFIDEMLYASSQGPRLDDKGKPTQPVEGFEYFQCPERVFVNNLPEWIGKRLGNEKNYAHTSKALIAIRDELEKMAVRQVCA